MAHSNDLNEAGVIYYHLSSGDRAAKGYTPFSYMSIHAKSYREFGGRVAVLGNGAAAKFLKLIGAWNGRDARWKYAPVDENPRRRSKRKYRRNGRKNGTKHYHVYSKVSPGSYLVVWAKTKSAAIRSARRKRFTGKAVLASRDTYGRSRRSK